MGNVTSRTNGQNDRQQASENRQHGSIFLAMLQHMARQSPAPSTAPSPIILPNDATSRGLTASVTSASSTGDSSSASQSSRYNLRRTVTRIRRERQQPRPFFQNNPENSTAAMTSGISSDPAPNPDAPPPMLSANQNNNRSAEEHANHEQPSRRTRVELDDLAARIEDNDILRRLNQGLGPNDEDDRRSIFFTFPWRGSEGGSPRHIVLVRVRHMMDVAGLPNMPPPPEATADGEQAGILQWTLYFLLPQSGIPVPNEQTSQTTQPQTEQQQQPQAQVNVAEVLAHAFAAFSSLINESTMTYEELTRLQEIMGFVSRGVDTESINEQLGTVSFQEGMDGEAVSCSICLSAYLKDDSCRRLPCSHFYHTECIDKWLNQVNQCPLCRKEVVSKKVPSSPPEKTPPTGTTRDFLIPPEDLD